MGFYLRSSGDVLRVVDKSKNELVMTLEKMKSKWCIFIYNDKTADYIYKKLPFTRDKNAEYDEVDIINCVHIIKTKFRKFDIEY